MTRPPLTDFADREPTCTRADEELAREVCGPETLAQARALIDKPRFTPGMRVLVTLRWQETGRRGEVRHYEQVRLGTVRDVAQFPMDAQTPELRGRGAVRVEVLGCPDVCVRFSDVEDAMSEGRP